MLTVTVTIGEEPNPPTSGLTCIQNHYTKKGYRYPSVMVAYQAKEYSSPTYTLGLIFHSLLTTFLSMTVTWKPYLKIRISFHLPFVEFDQNMPDQLIRIARATSRAEARDGTKNEKGRMCLAEHFANSYTLQLLHNLTSFDQSLQPLNMSPIENSWVMQTRKSISWKT